MKPRTTTNSSTSCTRHPHFKCMSVPQVHRLRQRQHRHARAYMCRPPITSNYGRASYALLNYRHTPIEVCVDLPTNSCAPGKRPRGSVPKLKINAPGHSRISQRCARTPPTALHAWIYSQKRRMRDEDAEARKQPRSAQLSRSAACFFIL